MEQFEGIDVVLHFYHGAVELQGVIDQVLKGIEIDIVAEEGAGYIIGNVLKAHLRHVVDEGFRQLVDFFGHIESAVFGQSFDDGLAQIGLGGLMIGAVVFHFFVVIFSLQR